MGVLKLKEVDFQGDNLLAIQKQDEKVYASVAYVCDGIGFTEGQKKRQVNNLKKDIVLQGATEMIRVNLDGTQSRELLCIELDFLPIWLAKISITPKMRENTPKLTQKLINYQIKAKDVLANAFVHNVAQILPKTYKDALIELVESLEENEKLEQENLIMKPKAEVHDEIVASVNTIDMMITAKNIGVGEYKLFEFLRATKVLFKQGGDNYPYQQYQNDGYFKIATSTRKDKYDRDYTFHTTKVTGSGKVFILNLVNKYGGAEKINGLLMKEIKGYVRDQNVKMKALQ